MNPTVIARPNVLAIIVARGDSPGLGQVIEAVGAAQSVPEQVVVANIGRPSDTVAISRRLKKHLWGNSHVIDIGKAKNFGDAIRQALTSDSLTTSTGYLWLLHEDSLPHSDALAALVARAERGGTVAAVGPKQVEWGAPTQLLEIGIEATKGARRLPLVADGEIDQGQYDDRSDVLAIGTAGMLVRSEVWKATRGLDPHLGPFGDGLEYGRRLRRAGYRVVVEPRAVVEHARQSFDSSAYAQIREAQLYNWLVASPFGMPLLLVIALAIWSPLRALGRMVARQPRMAAAEISAYFLLLGALPAVGRARRRLRRGGVVPASALTPLEATSKELRARRRSIRRASKQAPERRMNLGVLGEQAFAAAKRKSRASFATFFLILCGASIVLWYPFFSGLAGGSWANLPSTWSSLWGEAWSYWVLSGSGAPGPVNPILPVLSILSLPWWLVGISPLVFAIGLVVAAWPLAFAGGWAAASSLTRSVPLKTAFGLLWVGLPPLTLGLADGALGQVIAWVTTPYVFACIWRAFRELPPYRVQGLELFEGKRASDPLVWSGLAGLALIVASGGAPGLIIFAAGAAYLSALLPGHNEATLRTRIGAATAVWVPAALWVLPSWSLFWVGLFDPTSQGFLPLELTIPLILGLVALGALTCWAVVSLVISSWQAVDRPWTIRIAGLFAVVAVFSGAPFFGWSLAPAGLWAIICLALGIAGLSLVGKVWAVPRGEKSPGGAARRWLATGVGGAAIAGCVGLFFAMTAASPLVPAGSPLIPKIAEEAQISSNASRLLVLQSTDEGIDVTLWRGVRDQQVDLSPGAVRGSLGDQSLATAAATISAQPSDAVAAALAEHAVDLVLVPAEDHNAALRDHLDTSGGFERIGTTELGTMWRVRPNGMVPGRVMLDGEVIPAGHAAVDTQISGSPGVITLAEAADAGWAATFEGISLEATGNGWNQAFEFPGGEGRLQISYRSAMVMTWGILAAIGAGLLVMLAIPWHPRRTSWAVLPEEEPAESVAADEPELDAALAAAEPEPEVRADSGSGEDEHDS